MKKYIFSLLLVGILATGCENEYLNPSTANSTLVANDITALIALANGTQLRYSVGRASPNYTLPTLNGLLSRELLVLNAGNTDELLLGNGGASVLGNNGVLSNLWNQSNLVKANAQLIIDNAKRISSDAGTTGPLLAHAKILRALALGNLAMFWQSAPISVEKNAPFATRAQILNEIVTSLEGALVDFNAAAPSSLFNARIVGGINYANTINALIARYSLMAGNYDKALAAANLVATAGAASRSSFSYEDLNRNPMFDVSFGNRNVTEPVNALFSLTGALQPPAADRRIAFYFNSTAGQNRARASFFTANTSALPIYLPGEIFLIRAEAHVRKSTPDLAAAVVELNRVLQKVPGADIWGIGADLPAYSGPVAAPDILTEIYRQRCIELYLSGMRLEDSRRFGRPQTERGRDFLPYPFSERDNNTNTPADPTF